MKEYGFSILPLFVKDTDNINSGHYQLPVFEGGVKQSMLEDYYQYRKDN
jgi:hypothetical protein